MRTTLSRTNLKSWQAGRRSMTKRAFKLRYPRVKGALDCRCALPVTGAFLASGAGFPPIAQARVPCRYALFLLDAQHAANCCWAVL